MKLPKDFWETFDERLEKKLDQKLDQKLDAKFNVFYEKIQDDMDQRFAQFSKSINKRFTKIDKKFEQIDQKFGQIDQKFGQIDQKFDQIDERLDKMEGKIDKMDKRLTQVHNWTRRQDEMMEREIQMGLFRHLEERFKGYFCIIPKVFPKRISDGSGEITEFDGIIILTNSKDVKNKFTLESNATSSTTYTITEQDQIYLIIAEAKQTITNEKVLKKINQRKRIEDLIQRAKENPNILPTHLQEIGLHHFQSTVGLYIGGQDFAEAAKKTIQEDIIQRNEIIEKLYNDKTIPENVRKMRPVSLFTGWLELNGTRFSVFDEVNQYGEIAFGGGKNNRATKKSYRPYHTFTMGK